MSDTEQGYLPCNKYTNDGSAADSDPLRGRAHLEPAVQRRIHRLVRPIQPAFRLLPRPLHVLRDGVSAWHGTAASVRLELGAHLFVACSGVKVVFFLFYLPSSSNHTTRKTGEPDLCNMQSR